MHAHGRMHEYLNTEQAGGLAMLVAATVWLASFAWPTLGSWVVLILGLALLAAFALNGQVGFLIPGAIVTALGTGVLLAANLEDMVAGAAVLLSLAVGFAAIWVITRAAALPEHHFWPLVPAAILTGVGAALLVGRPEALEFVGVIAAVALLGVGVAVIFRGSRKQT